ncbi:MAG: glycosyltransferase [Chitinophagaceae bacterium]|nr:glycosyltransferase [Chitinophagaceae bacterium]
MHTLAIFSPNQNAYSETFIQAHKNLPFNVKYYYGDLYPSFLEGKSMMNLPLRLRAEKKMLKGFSAAEKKLIFSLKNEGVDAVLAEYGTTGADTLAVLRYLKLPLVVHFHGADASIYDLLELYKGKYKALFKYASSVIVVSSKMKNDLIRLGCPKEKLVMNPYGPNPVFFDIMPGYKGSQFISVGRFVEKKAPHLTIMSFNEVLETNNSTKLIMIGDGPLLPVCKDLAKALNISDKIEFFGVQPPETIRKIMEESIAFVQHSVIGSNGDSEGTPVAVLEAQAAGLPVIATNHAGIPDVVLHEKSGLLCDERDTNGMASNMLRILREDGLAKRLGLAGKQRVKEHFTMEKHLGILETAINKAIAERV